MMNSRMKGFTLVETLVAITVIATALVGPLYAVQQALNASRTARDQLIAASLGQEAVEYVRSVRDGNYLAALHGSPRSWLYGFDGTGGSVNCATAACVVDPTQGTVSRTIVPLYLSTTKLYNQQASGTVTPFTRTVQIASVSGSTTEIVVTVTVSWSTKGKPYSMTLTERLHNWL